jgi:hypothetical protein
VGQVNTTANWREQTKRAAEWVERGAVGAIKHVQVRGGGSARSLPPSHGRGRH